MEEITENDALFLIAANASEESEVWELLDDLRRWDCSKINLSVLVAGLIEEGTVGFYSRSTDGFNDISESAAIEISRDLERNPRPVLFLTEEGWKRWDTDDWGITTKRARHLMFSNQTGSSSRVR